MRIFLLISSLITIISLNCIVEPSYSSSSSTHHKPTLLYDLQNTNLAPSHTQQRKLPYHSWTIATTNSISSLKWEQSGRGLNLFFIPKQNGTTKINLEANKNINEDYQQPYISLNIKELSIVLNRITFPSHWMYYSTLVHSTNEIKLLNGLKSNAPIHLIFSVSTSINIPTTELSNALPDFTQFFDRWNVFISNSNTVSTFHQTLPVDGMAPQLFALYKEADLYVHKCLQAHNDELQTNNRDTICEKRNALLKQLQDKGWCWGSGDPDQHDKDKNWKKCILTPKGGIEKLNNKKVEDFNKAKLISNN